MNLNKGCIEIAIIPPPVRQGESMNLNKGCIEIGRASGDYRDMDHR